MDARARRAASLGAGDERARDEQGSAAKDGFEPPRNVCFEGPRAEEMSPAQRAASRVDGDEFASRGVAHECVAAAEPRGTDRGDRSSRAAAFAIADGGSVVLAKEGQ